MFERIGLSTAVHLGGLGGGIAGGVALGTATGSVAVGTVAGIVGLVAGALAGPGTAWHLRQGLGGEGELSRLLAGRPSLLPRNSAEVGETISISLEGGERVPIHYFEFGAEHANQGTFVLIHGLQSHSYEWANFLPLFATDEKGNINRHVLVIDLPGFGYSGFLPGHDYRFSGNLSNILEQFLRQKVGERPVTLVANSLGTAVSLTLASLHPDLVKQLILFSPLAPIGPEASIAPPVRMMAGKKVKVVSERLSDWIQKTSFRLLMWHMLYETAENISKQDVEEMARPYLCSAVGRDRVREMFKARAGWCQAIIDYLRNPSPFAVEAITQATLLVYPDGDRVFTLQERRAAEQLTKKLPDGTLLTVFPDATAPWPAGHALPTTNPPAAVRIVRDVTTPTAVDHGLLRKGGSTTIMYLKDGYREFTLA